jgi:TolB-like protein
MAAAWSRPLQHTVIAPLDDDQNVRRFDRFVLNVRSRELHDGTRRLVLQAQPFEVLHALIERAGEVVDRAELSRRLWPDGTFVDYEHGLNAAVMRVRRALDDAATHPRFIETVPRRGYRFIAPVIASPVVANPVPPGSAARVAVLPLTHIGAGVEFTDGLTEELLVQIGRLTTLAVIARSSSMLFKDGARRAEEIGKALRADYLLDGSVRVEGDRIRIVAWLVETAGETHVWTDTVECSVERPLAAQIDAATRLAKSLHAALPRIMLGV